MTGLGGGTSLRLLPLTPTSTSSSATFPFRLRKEPEQPVSTLVFEDRHTSHCSAGCFSRSHILPKPLFLDSGSLHHGNRFGSSQSIPRWSLRLCRRGATLKKMQPGPRDCFHVLIAYFGLWHRPRDFSAEGCVSPCLVARLLSLTLPGVSHTHFLHPW